MTAQALGLPSAGAQYGRPNTGPPAWGAKKVGEKLSFSPRASGGVTYRNDGYFGFTPK